MPENPSITDKGKRILSETMKKKGITGADLLASLQKEAIPCGSLETLRNWIMKRKPFPPLCSSAVCALLGIDHATIFDESSESESTQLDDEVYTLVRNRTETPNTARNKARYDEAKASCDLLKQAEFALELSRDKRLEGDMSECFSYLGSAKACIRMAAFMKDPSKAGELKSLELRHHYLKTLYEVYIVEGDLERTLERCCGLEQNCASEVLARIGPSDIFSRLEIQSAGLRCEVACLQGEYEDSRGMAIDLQARRPKGLKIDNHRCYCKFYEAEALRMMAKFKEAEALYQEILDDQETMSPRQLLNRVKKASIKCRRAEASQGNDLAALKALRKEIESWLKDTSSAGQNETKGQPFLPRTLYLIEYLSLRIELEARKNTLIDQKLVDFVTKAVDGIRTEAALERAHFRMENAHLSLLTGECFLAAGKSKQAIQDFNEALSYYESAKLRSGILRCHLGLHACGKDMQVLPQDHTGWDLLLHQNAYLESSSGWRFSLSANLP